MRNILSNIKYKFFIALTAVLAVSCSEEIMEFPTEGTLNSDEPVKIRAGVREPIETRDYYDPGIVDHGKLFLSFQNSFSSSIWSQAEVNFGMEGAPTIGFTSRKDAGGNPVDLLWSDVYSNPTNNNTSFRLDNVDPALFASTPTNLNALAFKTDGSNPFVAGPYDYENGSNDLLWGTITTAQRYSPFVNFELHHMMSLVQVNVICYPSDDGNPAVDLTNADVVLTNIKQKAYNYTRNTGIVGLSATASIPSDLFLVGEDKENEKEKVDWDKSFEVQGESVEGQVKTGVSYFTKDFILPPQALTTDDSRTKIEVRVPKSAPADGGEQEYKVYSAYLPTTMLEQTYDENGNPLEGFSPYNLEFLKERRLIITATINSPNAELYLMPVTVEPWVSKGTQYATGRQSGIYSAADFYDFITQYNAGNETQLTKYGYKKTYTEIVDEEPVERTEWIFQFWRYVTLSESRILNQITPKNEIPFKFYFNGYTVKIDNNGSSQDLTGAKGQTQLYNKVTNSNLELPGIDSKEKFQKLIEDVENENLYSLSNYGSFNGVDDTWYFEFTADINFNLGDVESKLVQSKLGNTLYSFHFLFNGHKISVKNENGEEMIKDENSSYNETLFSLIAADRSTPNNYKGIFSTEEFMCLPLIFNDYREYMDRVSNISYSSKTGITSYSIVRKKGATVLYLDELETLEPMDPEDDATITYSFSGFDAATCYMESEGKRFLISTDILYKIMNKNQEPGIKTTTDLSRLITYYYANNNKEMFKYLGEYDEAEGKWTFKLKANLSWAYSYINKKMIPDPSLNREEYNFDLGEYTYTVTNYVTSGNTVILSKEEEGDRKLYEILSQGTFND